MPITFEYFKETKGERPETKCVTSVFAKWPVDGLYYEVELLSLNREKNSCRVRYEDNLEVEAPVKDLHCQLNDDELRDDEIVCCICGNGDNAPNIILCDTCNQGYHLDCHKPDPKITKEELDDEDHSWVCSTCEYMTDSQGTSKKRSRQSTAGAICVTPKRAAQVLAKCQSEPKRRAPVTPKNIKKTPKVKLDKPLKAPAAPSIPANANNPQTKKIRQMNRKQNTAELSVPEELVETQIVEFTQPDQDVKAESEANVVSPDDGVIKDKIAMSSDNQQVVRIPRGKVDTLKPELVVVAETLTKKPSSVGKKCLNAIVDSSKMVDIMNDETSDRKVNVVNPQPLAITNGETRPESPSVIKAQKKQRKIFKTVAPAS